MEKPISPLTKELNRLGLVKPTSKDKNKDENKDE